MMVSNGWFKCSPGVIPSLVALGVALGAGGPRVVAAPRGDGGGWPDVGVSRLNPLLQKKDQEAKRGGSRGVDRRRRGGTRPQKTQRKKATPTARPPRNRAAGAGSLRRSKPEPPQRGATEAVTSRLNVEADDLGKPPEERTYSFSIVDGSYKDLVENFARMAGIGVLGEAPIGPVTFVSPEKMDFKSALNRVRLLLFKYKPLEPYWLIYEKDRVEVLRVTDVWRYIPLDHIFMNVAAFEASTIDDNELAMLLYTPTDTSVADFTLLRDFMPDYVRIAPMEKTNSLSIFALVSDIKKYLSLIKLFEGAGEDPRVLVKLPVEHLTPSVAVETLRRLMDDLEESASASKPRRPSRGGDSRIDLPGQRTILFPDDAQGVIIVRAVPKKIDDIKEMITFVDVDFGADEIDPVLIPIVHADVNDIINIIKPLLTKDGSAPGRPAARPPRGKAKKAAAPSMLKTDAVVLLPNLRTNTLVVVAADEDLERVRRYVALFDMPVEDGRPVFVRLEHSDPNQLAPLVTQVISGPGRAKPGATAFNVIAEPKSNSLILIGPREDIARAQDFIAQVDVDDGEERLHSYQLLNASPATVLDVIQMIDTQVAPGPASKGKRSRARRSGKAHLYTDEGLRILYVFCSDDEWTEKYLPLAESLDQQARQPSTHVSIRVEHQTADEVIATLTALFGQQKKGGKVRFASANDDVIVVSGATPAEVAQIRAIIADVDLETAGRERRLFHIEHADPLELQTIIGTVLGSARAARPGGKRSPAAAGSMGVVAAVLDRTLVVGGTPDDLDDVADLIDSLDVPDSDEKETRVYTVRPGRDTQNIVGMLESLLVPTVPKMKRPKAGRNAAMFGDVRVVAHAATHRILVSAPRNRFAEIEKTLDMLLAGESPEVSLIRFIPVEHVSADDVAALIEPILQTRMSELVTSGVLFAGELKDLKRSAAKKGGVNVTSDMTGERVIVTGPATIVAEAEALVAELDRSGADDDRIMRTITLTRSEPGEMVSTINAMLTGQRSSPKPKRPQLKQGRAVRASAAGASGGTADVTIVAAPGAAAVVLRGKPDDVDEVEGWVRHLDETATTDTTLKIYHIETAEIEQLADTIMDLCDSGAPKPLKKGRSDSLGPFDFEPVSHVRKGGEITLTTDYWNKVILVRATPMKIFEIDRVVELFDGKEGAEPVISASGFVPYLIYELETVDAFDATIALESLLDVLWTHGEPPDVDYISGTNNLVVKCLPEYNGEIEQMIRQYVDKESERAKRGNSLVYETVSGASAAEFANMLKMRLPGVRVHLKQLGEDLPTLEELKPYRPCVLPLSLLDAMGAAAASAVGQTADVASDAEKEAAAKRMLKSLAEEPDAATTDDAGTAAERDDAVALPEVTVRFDNRQGVLVIEGPPRVVDDVRDELEDIQDEIESMDSKPNIRVFRIKHRNVSVAANILETMFNAAKTPRQQAQAAAQQLRLQQMQRRMQQMQKQRGQQGAKGGQTPPVPGAGQKEEEKKKGTGQIRIFPDPQTKTLIIRAAPEDFPVIIELLATIDRPPDVTNEFRIFQLEKLVASEVEEQLKVLLGVGQPSRRPKAPRRGNPRGGQNPALQQIEDALLSQLAGSDVGAIDASSDIKITSDDKANTLLVMAPEPALVLIEEFIEKLQAQDIPDVVRRVYEIKYADATEVVSALKEVFGGQPRRGGGKGRGRAAAAPATTSASFTADTRTNTVIVSALEKDFAAIEALVTDLDRQLDDGASVQTYVLRNADAGDIARTLSDVFGVRGGRGPRRGGDGAKTIKFVGDAGSNTLFVTAPADLRDEIATHIQQLDTQAGERAKPKVIVLNEGKASEVARSLQDAFGDRGRKSGVKIVGNDLSNQLIVTAPEDLFVEIEALAHTMDQSSMAISTRVFRLEHARAGEVHSQLTDIVRQLGTQLRNRKSMDVFTSVADERSNTIVCVGGPVAFGLVEQVIREIDVPESETGHSRIRKLITLEHAEAADLARVINEDLRSARGGGGRRGARRGARAPTDAPVSVIANEALNSLLIGGLADEVEEIVALAKDMDKPAVDQERVTRVYAVNYADPGSLVGTINNMFRQRRGSKPEDTVDVGYDWGTSKLVITANAENHDKVALLLTEVDDASVNVRSERIIQLKYANADELSRNLQQLFRQTVRGQRGQQVMTIAGDPGTNALIVYGNDAEFDRVQTLVTSLDKRPEESRQRMIKGIKLTNANPWAVKTAITSLFRSRSRNPLDEVTAVEEWDTMSVIVSASPENMAKVEAFITGMDQPSATDSQIHVVELEHAEGAAVHRSLQDLYGRRGRRGQDPRGPAIQVSNPQGTNTILVKANQKDFAEISQVIAELDSTSGSPGDIEVIALQHTDADAMKEYLENYLSKPGARGGRGGGALRGDVRISANPQNNTIVVSGSAEEVEQLIPVIAELDQEVEGAGNAPRIVPLKVARASQIEPILTQMFVDAPRRGGRGRRGSSATPAPVITTDEAGNALIIRASASDFTHIQSLIDQLDTASTASQETFTIVPVAEGLQVEDLATMVETTINEGERIKAQRLGIDPGTIVVTPDKRTSTLVLAGSQPLFADARMLVSQMETKGPTGGQQMRVLDPTNISPDELKRLLEQVIDENTASQGRGSRVQGRRSGSRRASPRGSRTPRSQRNRQPPRRGGARRGR